MTRTGPAGVAMSACGHASVGRPVLARPAWVSVWPLSHEPIVVGAVFPGSAPFKPAFGRWSGRSGRPRPHPPPQSPAMLPHRPVRASGRRPPCPPPSALAHPLYLYLPERAGTAVPVGSFDPGRDMLCTLTSPPPWLQWP